MQKIIDKAVQGDVEAFLELMDRNTLSMYKVARAILKNDHDTADAIQDTILNCFEKIHTLKKHEYFKTWMIRILIIATVFCDITDEKSCQVKYQKQ